MNSVCMRLPALSKQVLHAFKQLLYCFLRPRHNVKLIFHIHPFPTPLYPITSENTPMLPHNPIILPQYHPMIIPVNPMT
jgi:hypothetical protein